MALPSEKLAQALEVLHALHKSGQTAIKSGELTRIHRERLLKNGFIKEVTKGWYIPTRPDLTDGDTTAWYNAYWEFAARFLNEKYGQDWIVSAEQSLMVQTDNWTVPRQLMIKSSVATNYGTQLPHETSLFSLRVTPPAPELTQTVKNLRLYTLPASLVFCSANTFTNNPVEARTALSMIRDSSEILTVLLGGGHSTYAGRLAGAFRNIRRDKVADEIVDTMKRAGYEIRETDPFEHPLEITLSRDRSPYVNRIRLMWQQMRPVVIAKFPDAPGIPADRDAFIKIVDEIYVTDAYHSLSIERYRVTAALIEKVRSGQWDHRNNDEDRLQRDAMAARGYWQSFQQVKASILKIFNGENGGDVLDRDHGRWYVELFDPSVVAGILKPEHLAGYRSSPVYIGGSKHTPLNVDAVRDAMPVLFELLRDEPEASVRAVLGHFIFVYIHPYSDGNGRVGRFIMNAMLASGGFPWTVIPVGERSGYMKALESASVEMNIGPFADFMSQLVNQSMQGKPVAKL